MGNALAKEFEKLKKKEVVDLRKRGLTELPTTIGNLRCKEFILAENDYITRLLLEDAKKFNDNFSRFGRGGTGSSLPKDQPRKKPNSLFFKNVLEHTLGHNSSLLKQQTHIERRTTTHSDSHSRKRVR